MIYYVQKDKENKIIGYSSSKMHEDDIKIDDNNIDKAFLNMPLCYRYNPLNNKIEKDEGLEQEIKEKRLKRISPEIKARQEASSLMIEIARMQCAMKINKELTEEDLLKWKKRYEKKWITIDQLNELKAINFLSEKDLDFIISI